MIQTEIRMVLMELAHLSEVHLNDSDLFAQILIPSAVIDIARIRTPWYRTILSISQILCVHIT